MINNSKYYLFLFALLFFASCDSSIPEEYTAEIETLPEYLDFNIHVKPILSDKCYLCHGPDEAKQEANLRLDNLKDASAPLTNSSGKVAISPRSLKNSEVYHRIISDDPEYMMPVPDSHLSLTTREKAILIKWIKDGAEYKPHWAFLKPKRPNVPEIAPSLTAHNPIDNFIIDRLKNENLQPSEEANKEILLRRLSFDLIGLPPTQEEINSFLNDTAADAYEKQIDRLLASPHYGERMAMDWLDLARYSDTHGYQADMYRDVSPWRDWVIEKFNENLSYKTFLQWQLAGDLLPNPTQEQILATTFLRLHPQNLEGGIVDEEFRVEYVSDRVSLVGTGLMGLSLACAKCHDHKFDPISQKNFFELYSFFNNVNETGQIPWEASMPVPTLLLPKKEQAEIIAFYESIVDENHKGLKEAIQKEKENAKTWIENAEYQTVLENHTPPGLVAHYNLNDNLSNRLNPREIGFMEQNFSKNEKPTFEEGHENKGLLLDGDTWLNFGKVGVYQRKDAFSIGLWVNVPEDLSEGVFFHKGKGARLHSYRGYHLYLVDNKIEVMLAHTWPDDAIVEKSIATIPKDEWVHLMMTYDGSSKASGVKIFLNGNELETETIVDNLYKDIIFHNMRNYIYKDVIEPGLQIGARWRGVGIKGAKVDDVIVYNSELTAIDVLKIVDKDSYNQIASKAADELSLKEHELLLEYYNHYSSDLIKRNKQELQDARAVLFDSIESVQEIMVMKDMETPRQAYILERGVYDSYGEEVFPKVPEHLLPWDPSLPKNRLGLATWLTDDEHPLTARVAVNRYWQIFFGRGLVRTSEDFGNQGELPSHPKLLDWLAMEFIDSNWDVKALQKKIVMSATYRQSSITAPELLEKDSENMLLARGPKMRLTSEMMRDNALAASDLLNREIGGESVRPYQPEGLWSMNTGKYVQDTGDALYRRSLYTFWKRTVPNPTLYTFDQPDREVCTIRRQKTNTPLQALVLLNDPTYIETAKVIGESITKNGSTEESIANAYKSITGRTIKDNELELFVQLQKDEYRQFKKDKQKMKGWLNAGEYEIDNSLDKSWVAANAIVASVIINSDATITKR